MSLPLDARTRRSHTPLALCVTAALGLNAAGLVAFADVTTHWPEQNALPRRAPSIVHVMVMQPKALEAAQKARDLEPTQASSAAVAANREPIADADRQPKAIALKPTLHESAPMRRFYASGEVDWPAEPDGDWNLDTAALDSLRIDRLVFDLFIDASGKVVACAVLEPADLDSDVRRALEDRIRLTTTLRPATRSGVAVASVRRIEMTVLPALE